jgi:hypothetical protein
MSKVKQELSKKTTTEKTDYSDNVVKKMTGNANFESPNPPLTTISGSAALVKTALAELDEAKTLAQTKASILAQYEAALDNNLTQLGSYVENVSNGDEAKILSAGMDVQKERTSAGLPDKITSVNATFGENSGIVLLTWDKITGVKSYVVQIAVNNGSTLEWKHLLVTTKAKGQLTGLITGTSYQIRVAAVNSAGQGLWSDPIIKVAP